ncbi:hypothetical protein Lalb_Chr15g0083061 [Lupinus albus]|uniref:Uncharacterized protein n=1 Tax=Lupinus albus TaxID=3870 RepID=A0A6A4P1N1_LUPAL|nr:hypothetical protein Lalb_Chr15g0083061 [Lupinus albus]
MGYAAFCLYFMLVFAMTCFSGRIPSGEYEKVLTKVEHGRALHHASNPLHVYHDPTTASNLSGKLQRLLVEIDYENPHPHPPHSNSQPILF